MKNDQLTILKEQFQKWRAIKKSGDRIPDYLWSEVRQLLQSNTYKRSAIGHALSISTSQLRMKFPDIYRQGAKVNSKKSDSPVAQDAKSSAEPFFVKASLPSDATFNNAPAPKLVLQQPNGLTLILEQPSETMVTALLNRFFTSES